MRPTTTALAAAITAPLLALITIAAIAGAITAPNPPSNTCAPGRIASAAVLDGVRLNADQLRNATVIIATGTSMGVPPPGETIALATALQESDLHNLPYGDRDSFGLFQQRPSQGWGTPAQILNPTYAAKQFYTHLLAVPDWRSMSTTAAAQAVQHSATPDAYQTWQPLAASLASQPDGTTVCATNSGDGGTISPTDVGAYRIPAGTPASIVAVLQFALAQLGKPYRYGATGPDAYDCSGLTQAAYASIGIHLPRTTYQQVDVGIPINNLTRLQPGDLIFIPGSDGTPTNPGHVGIYAGNNALIQAPHTGTRITLTQLSIWSRQIVAVRRIL
jgi:cell wall-associated NlpC family hydrolase